MFLFFVALSVMSGQSLDDVAAAVQSGDVSVLRSLLDGNPAISPDEPVLGNLTPLLISCRAGHVDVVQFLLDRGADPNLGNHVLTPLTVAASEGHVAIVELLLAKEARVDAAGPARLTALGEAAAAGHVQVVEQLLHAGAQRVLRNSVLKLQPIVVAGSHGRLESLTLLVSEKDIDSPVVTAAFINAAWNGHADVVAYLLERGVNPNATDVFGRNALSAATGADRPDIERLLEGAGAKRYVRPPQLIAAARRGEFLLVSALIDAGTNVNVQGPDGMTPLMAAVRAADNDVIVRLLLTDEVDVDATDDRGMTALMWAAGAGESGYVWALLDFGADAALRDRSGKTAEDFARAGRHDATGYLLSTWRTREARF